MQNKTAPRKVWVEVEVNKYTERGIIVFRGQISREQLQAWASGAMVDCALCLENTYTVTKDGVLVLGQGEPPINHYSGTIYINVDTIMLLFELKEGNQPPLTMGDVNSTIVNFPGRGES